MEKIIIMGERVLNMFFPPKPQINNNLKEMCTKDIDIGINLQHIGVKIYHIFFNPFEYNSGHHSVEKTKMQSTLKQNIPNFHDILQ